MVQFSVLALLLELILFQCVGEKWMLLITCIDRLMVQKSSYWKKSCDKLQTESATVTIMTLNDLRCYHMLFFSSTNYFFENQLFIAIFHFVFSSCRPYRYIATSLISASGPRIQSDTFHFTSYFFLQHVFEILDSLRLSHKCCLPACFYKVFY